MCITEYNEKTFIKGIREEGREESRMEILINMLKKEYQKEAILDLGYSEAEYEKAEKEYRKV